MAERILVFIPAYNCEKQIGRVLAQFDRETAALFSKIIVVDNGSKDATVESARIAAANVPLPVDIIRNRQNYSLGGSIKSACGGLVWGRASRFICCGRRAAIMPLCAARRVFAASLSAWLPQRRAHAFDGHENVAQGSGERVGLGICRIAKIRSLNGEERPRR